MKELTNKQFQIWLLLIGLTGGIIRFVNINYASLWGDELYSLFSVHPSNSWYEVLYWQRAMQPPLYFMVLWVWLKVFVYNEFYARLLSVLAGVLCIFASGYLGKVIKNRWVGIGMAILIAFSPTQIWYSLEARFYVFVYLFAALSLLLYWYILQNKTKNLFLFFLKAVVDAALCYFHHFGIVFVFAQFSFDLYLLFKEKDRAYFLRNLGSYVLAASFYAPWVFWGLLQGLSVKQYWLKETDVLKYYLFNLDYPVFVQLTATAFIIVFLVQLFRNQLSRSYLLLPVICFFVIAVPVAYSYIKFPILVDRYAMVMAPAIYLMVLLGMFETAKLLANRKLIYRLFITGTIILFIFQGFFISFVDKDPLKKTPFRQMAGWVKQQPDYKEVNIYTHPAFFKNFMLIDFYLDRANPSVSLFDLKAGIDRKMYLIGGTSYWTIGDSVLNEVHKYYHVSKVEFQKGHLNAGVVYSCIRK